MDWIDNSIDEKKGKYLFKFLSKSKLELFLSTGSIWFSRADKFGDKLECVSINDLKKDRIKIENVINTQNHHLISCFHEATNETLAFWDTYSAKEEDRRVFALKFDLKAFCAKVENAGVPIASNKIKKKVHGKVIYKNLLSGKKEILLSKKVKHIALRKEYAFRYEREYRFVIRTLDKFQEPGLNMFLGKLESQTFNILINPLLDNDKYGELKQYLKNKNVFDRFEVTRITKFFKPEVGEIE